MPSPCLPSKATPNWWYFGPPSPVSEPKKGDRTFSNGRRDWPRATTNRAPRYNPGYCIRHLYFLSGPETIPDCLFERRL
ncbi:hypothetical protein GWI33_014110 [Rhynchophorus ferrugineus]|uniref:Uncharacterized protein n=1 Tax=Rhynchophorus ferrugineus TaxID=354439 RepID=A0A834I2D3_RHYFE|nr:hypothetical protein GWI33_014110 [Rhynchophorus ferrugineus]